VTIKVVNTATTNKPNAKYCPWLVDCITEPEDKNKK
jgi:hypothetical protein